jgi:hypothetical protein
MRTTDVSKPPARGTHFASLLIISRAVPHGTSTALHNPK